MRLVPAQFYATWRADVRPQSVLHEPGGGNPPEWLLQQLWLHQRLRADRLQTLDGRPLRVLHPGFWNHAEGPDFRQAVLQFDAGPPRSGDVEIDLTPADWKAHRHDVNPNYREVILHVLWETTDVESHTPAVLRLKGCLDAPLDELATWADVGPDPPPSDRGQCAVQWHELSAEAGGEVLQQAAWVRLELKSQRLAARARDVGWEQALWEGLFMALGYRHNMWPMRAIGMSVPHWRDQFEPPDVLHWQAGLLGLSGLLPWEPTRRQAAADRYLRDLWDIWWRERAVCLPWAVPRSLWRLGGLRPANHPQRRLAWAAQALASRDLIDRLEDWFTEDIPRARWGTALQSCLETEPDPFWSWHWTLRSGRLRRPQPLLGPYRVTDMAMNVLLPWFWARAQAGGAEKLQAQTLQRYFTWPPSQDNAVLRLARQRMRFDGAAPLLKTAAAQQGLLQIARDFCGGANALCEPCSLPKRLRGLG